ncbi:MAG: HAD family hydrolase [Pseudomonadota bacterium]
MPHPTYLTCREFGAAFLTPMLTRYVRALAGQPGPFVPVCLAREGWLLQQLLERLQRERLIELEHPPVYLQVSRTLLFRTFLGERELWPLALKGKYEGSAANLLSGRFGFQPYEYEQVLPQKLLKQEVKLPDDLDELADELGRYSAELMPLVEPTYSGFRAYLDSLGLAGGATPMLLDVGYAGTIQQLLTRLLQRDTRGLYFIASNPGLTEVAGHGAHMQGVLKEGVSMGDGYHMLDRSLFMECLLTAPHGQVVDIRQEQDKGFRFYYGRKAGTQRHFQDLEAAHHGAIDGVVHALRHDIDYTVAEIEQLYQAFLGTRNALPPGIWHLFSADDDISGNGVVNPLDLFGI